MNDDYILIVEDSRTYSSLLKRKIAKRFSNPIHIATTLAETDTFLRQYADETFLAVLDLTLPDAPKGEVVDLILRHEITAVVLTGTYSDEIRANILSKPILDYVVKENADDIDYIVRLIGRVKSNQETELLIVDDSATYRHLLRKYLDAYKYTVLEARDGHEALEMLQRHHRVKLVITDYNMPGMDGFSLVTHIRKEYSKDELAIIGLSAQNEASNALSARFLKHGANDFLYKPFSKEEFYCRLNQNVEILELMEEIKEASNRDYLTGLYNRRYLYDVGGKYFENARRNNLQVTVAMLDLDHFKMVNDSFGHEAGDQALKVVAETLRDALRNTDIVARFGGEEFCIIAVNMVQDQAYHSFERVRLLVEEKTIHSGPHRFKITLSAGVTTELTNSLADMIRTADEMLYRAKAEGRNRVILHQPVRRGIGV